MAIKKLCQVGLLSLCLLSGSFANAALNQLPGQFLQINTYFHGVDGHPSWLLILRDVSSGVTLPYYYEVKNNDNYWIALSFAHTYRVTVSMLKFDEHTAITNFCHLEDGIISGESMYITVSGYLSADPNSSQCHVIRYKDVGLTVVGNS